jgi:competence protein ComEA
MRKWLNTYFDFSKGEFNGLMTLFGLIILVTVLPLTFKWIRGVTDTAAQAGLGFKELVWMDQVRESNRAERSRFKKEKVNLKLFDFDPNRLDVAGWQKLGLSLKQAESIRKYVDKGGKFYSKEDVKKMYTISPELYVRLEPFITIEAKEVSDRKPAYVKYTPKILEVYDINKADTTALQEIRGIGPAFARRIASYRERLGGFYSLAQLREVFGLDSLKLKEISGQIQISTGGLRRININTAEYDDLKRHPYLKYKQVNAIIQYRKQHGNYTNLADLKKVVILPAETVDKLAPYLTF